MISDCRQTPTQMLHLSWDLFFCYHFLRFLSYLGWTWPFHVQFAIFFKFMAAKVSIACMTIFPVPEGYGRSHAMFSFPLAKTRLIVSLRFSYMFLLISVPYPLLPHNVPNCHDVAFDMTFILGTLSKTGMFYIFPDLSVLSITFSCRGSVFKNLVGQI